MLSENANTILDRRYLAPGENGWEDCSRRSGVEVARAETNGNRSKYAEIYGEMIYSLDFLPAGRTLRNAGRPRGSMLNCYVLPYGDSIREIGEFNAQALELWAGGGGVGANVSLIRPDRDLVKGCNGRASGPVSFLTFSNAGALTIESGGQRRAAMMAMLLASHPDIFKFMDAKLIDGLLQAMNISVAVTEDFLESVELGKNWDLTFNQKVYKTIKARDLWDKIITNMVANAEPGLINWDKLRENNSYYFAPVWATNPCGEAPMEPFGACCLGSLNLKNFIKGESYTNWEKMNITIKNAIRFLDSVLDINKYALPQIQQRAQEGRRVGLGVMGLAEYLFAKQIPYGSEKAVRETERLMRFIRDNVYTSLVELASEKGAFPKFDSVMYSKAKFIRTLPASIRMDIKKHGTRCVTGMAIAPTGTISLLPEVQSGIEPLFMKAYERTDRVSDRVYVHPIQRKILKEELKTPKWFVDTRDLKAHHHFDMQVAVQKFTDGAVSKTVNLPKGTTPAQLKKVMLEYIYDLKGATVYVDGCREGQILNPLTDKQALDHINKNSYTESADEETVECATGACEI